MFEKKDMYDILHISHILPKTIFSNQVVINIFCFETSHLYDTIFKIIYLIVRQHVL